MLKKFSMVQSKMPKTAIYPGTFDPITFGHLDLIERSGKIFGKIIVAVTDNPSKKPLFSKKERIELLKQTTKQFDFVEIDSFDGLLVDYARKKNVKIILRGLRELSDFAFEFQSAVINRKLDSGIETVFIMTNAKYFYLSSSIVKELAEFGGNISEFVPTNVVTALSQKLKKPQ